MLAKIEDWFYNRAAGQLAARAAVTLAAYLASGRLGASVSVDPAQVQALIMAGAHMLYSWVKTMRKPAVDAAAQP